MKRPLIRGTLACLSTIVGATTMHAQQASSATRTVPQFPSAVVRPVENDRGDLMTVKLALAMDGLSFIVRTKPGRALNSGWAGACIQNDVPVNLRNFNHVTVSISVSAPVTMDMKLERTRYQEGMLILKDASVIRPSDTSIAVPFAAAEDRGQLPTLDATRRMCFIVLADAFPRTPEVTVKVSKVLFDRRQGN